MSRRDGGACPERPWLAGLGAGEARGWELWAGDGERHPHRAEGAGK